MSFRAAMFVIPRAFNLANNSKSTVDCKYKSRAFWISTVCAWMDPVRTGTVKPFFPTIQCTQRSGESLYKNWQNVTGFITYWTCMDLSWINIEIAKAMHVPKYLRSQQIQHLMPTNNLSNSSFLKKFWNTYYVHIYLCYIVCKKYQCNCYDLGEECVYASRCNAAIHSATFRFICPQQSQGFVA